MKISVVVPAYNEEKLLGHCLESVAAAFQALAAPGLEHEVVVCDNNSSDATSRIAAGAGAKVVFEPVNQIGRARNAGAAAASGDWLLFIDADSRLEAGTLKQLVAAIGSGRWAGGGAFVELDPVPNFWGAALVKLWNTISRAFKWAAGSFLFCRADAFRETGGFSKDLYAAEEIDLSRRIGKWGAKEGLGFVILKGPHISSGRKLKIYTGRELAAIAFGFLRRPFGSLRDPKLLGIFYDGRR